MTFALRRKARHHGDRLTVVILPSGRLGAALLDLANRWAGAGLINAAAWVLPEDVTIESDAAPVVACHFVGPWGDFEGNLFEIIGQHPRDLVRVISAPVLESSAAVDSKQISAAAKVHAAVSKSVPALMRDEAGEQFGTEVIGINLITGVTGLHSVPRQVVDGKWNINLVTSPEDRRDPSRANTWIRPGENLPGVALASICAVGGLFAGVPQGPFDHTPADESQSSGRVRVVRTTVRAILGEGVIQEIVRRALRTAPEAGGPSLEEPHAFAPAPGDDLVAEAVEWALDLDQAALRRGALEEDVDVRPRTMSVVKGLLAFLRFYLEALITIPRAIGNGLLRRAESMVSGVIVGDADAAGVRLTVTPDASVGLGSDLLADEQRDIDRAADLIGNADRRSVRLPNADLWRALHQASESLLDGGDMPSGALVHVDGTRRVIVSDPRKIVPRPSDSIVLGDAAAAGLGLDTPARRTISACDPVTYHRLMDRLADEVSSARRALEAGKASVTAIDEQLAGWSAHKAKVDDGKATADPAMAEALAALGAQREAGQAAVSQCATYIDSLLEEQQRLAVWASARSGSLMWQLGDRVFAAAEEARADEARASAEAVAPSGLDPNAPFRLRRRFLRGVAFLAVALGVSAWLIARYGASWVTFYRHIFDWLGLWFFWGIWAAVLVVVLSLLVRGWYVGTLRYLRSYAVAWNGRSRALRRALAANADRRRLEVGGQQLASWSDIIGWTIHRPWSPDPQAPAVTQDPPDPAWFPAAVRLAYPSLDHDSTSLATDLAVATITSRGWRRRAFERLVARSAGVETPDALSRALEAIESDTTGVSGARSRLQQALASGVPQEAAAPEVIEEGARRLRERRLGAHRLRVHLQRMDPDEVEQIDDRDFLGQALVKASPLVTETWSDAAAAKNRHVNPEVIAWASPDAQARAAADVRCEATDSTQDDRQALVDVAVRIDMTTWVDVSELRLFEARSVVETIDSFAAEGEYT